MLNCDDDIDAPDISQPYVLDDTLPCQYIVTFSSKDVCPSFTTNALWVFLSKFDWLWGACYMLGGVFLCFFGRKLFIAAIFIITAFATCFLIMLLFYSTLLRDDTAEWIGWVILVCSAVIGIIVGAVMTRLQRVGAAILAGWGGFMLGLLINETFLYK